MSMLPLFQGGRKSTAPHGLFQGILSRQCFAGMGPPRPFVNDFDCGSGEGSGCLSVAPEGIRTPAFGLKFNKGVSGKNLLAVADEEGYISILDCRGHLPDEEAPYHGEESSGNRAWVRSSWQAHYNAVFDVTWTEDDRSVLTASGDQSMGLFDVETQEEVAIFRGHTGSVKSISQKPGSSHIFASGGRDGAVMLWDQRVHSTASDAQSTPVLSPVHVIPNAHVVHELQRRRGRRPGIQGESKQSVTSVLFLGVDGLLASAGAADGVVKLWDVRQLSCPAALLGLNKDIGAGDGLPAAWGEAGGGGGGAAGGQGGKGRRHGVSCMDQDPRTGRLLVSHSNSRHYIYDVLRPEIGPTRCFEGHHTSSFYVKCAFSPDGSHILSGSSDRCAHIWDVERPLEHSHVLEGHAGEVTGVAWNPCDFEQIATCADDATVRVWRIRRPEMASGAEPRVSVGAGVHASRLAHARGSTRVFADRPGAGHGVPDHANEVRTGGVAAGGCHGLPSPSCSEPSGGGEQGETSTPAGGSGAVAAARQRAADAEAGVEGAAAAGAGAGVGAREQRRAREDDSDEGDEGGEGGEGRRAGKRKKTLKDYFSSP